MFCVIVLIFSMGDFYGLGFVWSVWFCMWMVDEFLVDWDFCCDGLDWFGEVGIVVLVVQVDGKEVVLKVQMFGLEVDVVILGLI